MWKYYHIVLCLADKHYQMQAFLPLVPTKKTKKVFKENLEVIEEEEIDTSASS